MIDLNEELTLEKRNAIQRSYWKDLVKSKLVQPNDHQAFYVFGKYFANYYEREGKVVPFWKVATYIMGYPEALKRAQEVSKPKPIVTSNPNFIRWFGKSKVKDKFGHPRKVYHGTFADFNSFDIERGNEYSYFGRGFYFTSSVHDVNKNYSHLKAPDISAKRGNEIEEWENNLDDEERSSIISDYMTANNISINELNWKVERDAIVDYVNKHPDVLKTMVGHQGAVMECYLRMEKPCYVGFGLDDTFFEYNSNYNEDANPFDRDDDEPTGIGVEVMEFLSNYDEELADIWDYMYGGGIHALRLREMINSIPCVENGNDNGGEIFSDLILRLGYDGIIQKPIKSFTRMKNIKQAMHYIVFNPNQIKSATGNNGEFNLNSNKINESD